MGKPGKVTLEIKVRDVVEDGWKEFATAIGIDGPEFGNKQRREMKKSFLAGMSFMYGVINKVIDDCEGQGLGEEAQAAVVQSIMDRAREIAMQLASDQIAEMMGPQGGIKPN